MTILLNFAHPLLPSQTNAIEAFLSDPLTEVREIVVQFDIATPFAEQVSTLIDNIGLTATEWQTSPILIVPPAHSFIAITLLAELHGRMGYFPPAVRLRPVQGHVPVTFEVAEVVNLFDLRNKKRDEKRFKEE